MSPVIASVVFAILILGLFWLDRDPKARTSPFLWLPVLWLALAGSRSVGQWLNMAAPESSDAIMEGSPLDRVVYASLVALGIVVLITRGRQIAGFLRANLPIVMFFVFCLASLIWSDFPDVAFKRWTKAVGDFVMVLIVVSEREPLTAIKRLMTRTALFLIPLSVLFVKYYSEIGRVYGRWEGEAHYVGVTTNKNTLGAICLFFGLGAMWQLIGLYKDRLAPNRRGRMMAQGLLLAMALWLFRMADSMTALGCFLFASVLLLAMNFYKPARRPVFMHVLIGAVLFASVAVLFLGMDPGVLAMMGRNPTLTDRTEIWSIVLRLVDNPILGAGFESFWLGPRLESMWQAYAWGPGEAHNGYIEIYLNLGWAGLVLLAVVIAAGYRQVMAAYRKNAPVSSLMLTFFVVGLIYNFTEAAFFRMMAPAWIFFLLAITAVPDLRLKTKAPAQKISRPRYRFVVPKGAAEAQGEAVGVPSLPPAGVRKRMTDF